LPDSQIIFTGVAQMFMMRMNFVVKFRFSCLFFSAIKFIFDDKRIAGSVISFDLCFFLYWSSVIFASILEVCPSFSLLMLLILFFHFLFPSIDFSLFYTFRFLLLISYFLFLCPQDEPSFLVDFTILKL
jgi:hypothetical protein